MGDFHGREIEIGGEGEVALRPFAEFGVEMEEEGSEEVAEGVDGAVREEGDGGIIHKARGRPSNRRTPEKVRGKAIFLYKRKYHDFGPTLASEKLLELDGIGISDETLRRWLLDAGLWQKRRKRLFRTCIRSKRCGIR